MGVRGFLKNTVETIRRFFGGLSDDAEEFQEIEPIDESLASQALEEPFWLDGTDDSLSETVDPQPDQQVVPEAPFWLDGAAGSLSDSHSGKVEPLPEPPIIIDEGIAGVAIADEVAIGADQPDPIVPETPKPKPKRSRQRRSKKPEAIVISAAPKLSLSPVGLEVVNHPLDGPNTPIDIERFNHFVISAQPKSAPLEVDLEVVNHPVDDPNEAIDRERLNHIVISAQPKSALSKVDLEVVNHLLDLAEESVTDGTSAPQYLNGASAPQYLNGTMLPEEVDIALGDESFSAVELEQQDESPIHLNGASPSKVLDNKLDEDKSFQATVDDLYSESMYIESGGSHVSLESALESLLFVAEAPIDLEHLRKILGLTAYEIREGLNTLDQAYAKSRRGLRIQDYEDKFQLVTAPTSASLVEDFLSFNLSTRLSGPALEALAIVAYRQPVTRAQVEAVRGVDCGSVLRSLIQLGLVEESGRLEALGRPILYRTTDFFMQHFGLLKMSDLPPLESQEEETLLSQSALEGDKMTG